jgi:hypothetical protein
MTYYQNNKHEISITINTHGSNYKCIAFYRLKRLKKKDSFDGKAQTRVN